MFDSLAVIPVYVGQLQIVDNETGDSCFETVYIGLDKDEAVDSCYEAELNIEEADVEVEAQVKIFHITSDGKFNYVGSIK